MFAPNAADAFWPFSANADAAANAFIPSASTPVLIASVNRNPSASAPVALATSGNVALISYGGPAGTATAIQEATPSDKISVYVVRSGDTLSEIADMFNVSVNTIVWANDLKSVRDVHPGDTLIILPISGVEHTVVKGDTLKLLAKKYGADADEIATFNGLDQAPLVVGTRLIIPGGELSPAAPATPSAIGRDTFTSVYRGGSGIFLPGYFGNPVPGAIITQRIHGWNGVDLGAARGTPVYAAAAGIIIIARANGAWNGGYGNYIVITHDNASQTLYSHLQSAVVGFGQTVAKGQLIGYVGTTGRVTGAHLHFEVRGAANPLRLCRVGAVCYAQ